MKTSKIPQVAIAESAKVRKMKIIESYYENGIYANSITETDTFYLVSDNVQAKKQTFLERLFGIKKFVESVKVYAEINVNKNIKVEAKIYGSDNLEIVKETLSPLESTKIKVELVITKMEPLILENQIYYNLNGGSHG